MHQSVEVALKPDILLALTVVELDHPLNPWSRTL